MDIWIDTDSGTWGTLGQNSLVVVEVTEAQLQYLIEASDSEICEFGANNGKTVQA